MWGMHSIRETCGVVDIYYYLRLFEVIYTFLNLIQYDNIFIINIQYYKITNLYILGIL